MLRPHRRTMALGLFLGLIASAAGLATPMVTKWVLDSFSGGVDLVTPIAVLAALVVAGSVITLWQSILLGTLAERIVLDARTSIIRRYFRARVLDLQARATGELVTRVTADTGLLHQASSSIIGLINAGIGLIGTLVLMAVLDLTLLACTLGAVAVVGVLMFLLLPRIGQAQTAAQASVGNLGANLEGALRAIRTVKASRAEGRQGDQIVGNAQDAARHSIRAARVAAAVWTIAWSGINLAVILILAVGAWRASEGLLEVSSLVAFLLYVFQLMGPIGELTQNLTALQAGIAASGRINELESIALEPSSPGSAEAAVPAGSTEAIVPAGSAQTTGPASEDDGPVLALQGVTARYGPDTSPVLHGLDLEIPRRGHTAIVGPSGAGKTTLFSLLLRFLEPEEGRILLDGRPYTEWSHREVRGRLAYVEQETPVVPGTVGDNVRFTHPDATDAEVREVLRSVRLDELEPALHATDVSGGQRQRIALARALLRTPEVLLLDEATAQVDGLTEAAVQACIQEHARRGAVVTIAHRLSTVLDADRIVVVEDGQIRAQGTHPELYESDDLYRSLVEALRIQPFLEKQNLRTSDLDRLTEIQPTMPSV
ncbi:ABC transporter ATP-binding protein [Actinoplanes couchii]|uniref:ABC transporter ATP-binding protein n=1 Tax=Actinoplanes couchii TaxID=403638 RepID=A0ABQ3XGS9_9ACTN|nr:ABC transporter ATP-binding protein [Actinoplanes couchii]MDR6320823.1 ABC-type multidrug transport system fused ATPase/permease subunit [Actinoplanes couchii]GID57692.1 putative ABC transporter ATP-binding protein [Actinoplanes couchii]